MDFLGALSLVANTAVALRPNAGGAPDLGVVQELFGSWAANIGRSAPAAWLPTLAARKPCSAPRCKARGVAPCLACGGVVCLTHGFVGADAAVVCGGCLVMLQKTRAAALEQAARPAKAKGKGPRPAPAPVEEPDDDEAALEQAYALLGVDEDDSDEDIAAAFDRLKVFHMKRGAAGKMAIKALRSALRRIAEARTE